MNPYRLIIEREIRSRRQTEQWYRANAWAVWTDLRSENLAILRALFAIRREAKRAEALRDHHYESAVETWRVYA